MSAQIGHPFYPPRFPAERRLTVSSRPADLVTVDSALKYGKRLPAPGSVQRNDIMFHRAFKLQLVPCASRGGPETRDATESKSARASKEISPNWISVKCQRPVRLLVSRTADCWAAPGAPRTVCANDACVPALPATDGPRPSCVYPPCETTTGNNAAIEAIAIRFIRFLSVRVSRTQKGTMYCDHAFLKSGMTARLRRDYKLNTADVRRAALRASLLSLSIRAMILGMSDQ